MTYPKGTILESGTKVAVLASSSNSKGLVVDDLQPGCLVPAVQS